MKLDTFAVASLLFLSAPSLALPQPVYDVQLVAEDAAAFEPRDADVIAGAEDLWKRKGGGGGGGKGGGSSSGGSSSGGGSTSSGSGKGGSGSSSSSSGYDCPALFFTASETLHAQDISNNLAARLRQERLAAKAPQPLRLAAPPSRVPASSQRLEEGNTTAEEPPVLMPQEPRLP